MTTTPDPARNFRHSRAHLPDRLYLLLRGLQALLDALVAGTVPGPGYSLDDVEAFVRSAVKGQRGGRFFARPGTWALTPDSDGVPKDARHEFIMLPTWIVSSILAWFRLHHPARAAAVPGLDEALRAGLAYSVLNGLRGPGSYGGDDALVALRLFAESGVTRLVLAEPSFCPELPGLLRRYKATYIEWREKAGDDPAFGALTRADCEVGLRWLGDVAPGP